jgi:hypothetical protein
MSIVDDVPSVSSSSYSVNRQNIPTSSQSSSSLRLESLPDDCLQTVFEFLSTYETFVHLVHGAPSKAWRNLWHGSPVVDLDLERDIAEDVAPRSGGGGNGNTGLGNGNGNGGSGGESDVLRIIAAKKSQYGQLIHLISKHSQNLMSLHLANFGTVLADEIHVEAIATADGSYHRLAKSINLQNLLLSHSNSLVSLSLVASSIRKLKLGAEFHVLESLDLSKCKVLSDPVLQAPSLTSLDLSRTLLNDFELLKILPSLTKLQILRLVGCKNLRLFDGSDPRKLWEEQVPDLRILDVSNTGCIDACVNSLARHCKHLEVLGLTDCFALRHPQILSSSLIMLSLRNINRLSATTKIVCPNLKEVDLSKTNLRDVMVNGDGTSGGNTGQISWPNIEVMMLKNCFELIHPIFRNEEQIVMPSTKEQASSSSASSSKSPSSAAAATSHHAAQQHQMYPNLHTLDLSMCFGLGNAGLYHLLEMAPNLTFLNLQQCKEVREKWTVGGGGGVGMEQGQGQDEGGAADAAVVEERTDIFPPTMPFLQELCLRGCSVSDENMKSFFATPSVSSLTILNLRNNPKISGRYIRSSILLELDLRLTQLTDVLLSDLLMKCPSLRTLFVGQCEKLIQVNVKHDSLLEFDLAHCSNLRSAILDASNLLRVDASMNFALATLDVSRCIQLQTVNIQYSSLVSITPPQQAIDSSHHVEELDAAPSHITPQEAAKAPKPLYAYSNSSSNHGGNRDYEASKAERQDLARAPPIRGAGAGASSIAAPAPATLDEDEASPQPPIARSAARSIPSATVQHIFSSNSLPKVGGSSPPRFTSPSGRSPQHIGRTLFGSPHQQPRRNSKDELITSSLTSTVTTTSSSSSSSSSANWGIGAASSGVVRFSMHESQPLNSASYQRAQYSGHREPLTQHTPPRKTGLTPPASPLPKTKSSNKLRFAFIAESCFVLAFTSTTSSTRPLCHKFLCHSRLSSISERSNSFLLINPSTSRYSIYRCLHHRRVD